MLHTYQGSYETLYDFSADVSLFDGSSAGFTYDWSDRPNLVDGSQGCKKLGNEANGCEIIVLADAEAVDGANTNFKLWAYAENGPAVYLADVSCTVGTARFEDSTTALWIDTMTIDTQGHLNALNVKDSGNDRVCKLKFDIGGYGYLCCEMYDTSDHYKVLYRVW
jgi:hypothetical protein